MKQKNIIIIVATLIIALTAVGITASMTVFSADIRISNAVTKANKYLDDGNYSEAILQFDKAIKIDDKRADVWVAKINAQEHIDDTEGAADTLSDLVSKPYTYYKNIDDDAVNDIISTCIGDGWMDNDRIDQLESTMEKNGWKTEESDIRVGADRFVLSNTIGEIDGKVYCSRPAQYTGDYNRDAADKSVPTCETLRIDTGKYEMIGSFCYYKGYIYFTSTENGSADYSTALYRCKPDGSEQTLLFDMEADKGRGTGQMYEGERLFEIFEDKVYLGRYYGHETSSCYVVDLKTMSVSEGTHPIQEFDNGSEGAYTQATYKGYKIYNDEGTIYKTDGKTKELIVSTLDDQVMYSTGRSTLVTIDGAADGYIYYSYISASHRSSEYANANYAVLCRVPIDGGEPEIVDKRMPAGGGGPYFCW